MYSISGVRVQLEGVVGQKARFNDCCNSSRVGEARDSGKTDAQHPVTSVCRWKVLLRLGWMVRMKKRR